MFEAKIIADSICNGHRLTTMQVTHPRIVHAEFMTHAMFARNASSSRAIPFKKAVQAVIDDPFIPVWWGKNQKGMQATKQLNEKEQKVAVQNWLLARDNAIKSAELLSNEKCERCNGSGELDIDTMGTQYLGPCTECEGTGEGLNVHKQIANRLIEPWSWITCCVTGDDGAWSNYFALRCHADAQPEIATQAYMAQKAYFQSTPNQVKVGGWHIPYIRPEEVDHIRAFADIQLVKVQGDLATYKKNRDEFLMKVSSGRCARTSYLSQEGTRDFDKDVELHDRLRYHTPLHASPFEHVCCAMGNDERYAKYIGWKAYRHILPGEYVTDFKPNHPELVK